jgi:hypothetical protein
LYRSKNRGAGISQHRHVFQRSACVVLAPFIRA